MKNSLILSVILSLTATSIAWADTPPPPIAFDSLEELESFLGVDLPEDFDYQNFDPVQFAPGFGSQAVVTPEGTVNCFDYYTFGSVAIDLFNQVQTAVPGIPLTFKTTLTNNNPYPLVDGSLYVKVFRAKDDNIDTQINGDDIVDSFFALEGVSLVAGEAEETSFTWTPSRLLPAGDYYVAGYFSTAKRYNLAGLSFTDDIIGGKENFTLVSEADGLYFDKSKVTLDGQPHQFIAAPPRLDTSQPIPVEATIKNDADEDRVAIVSWEIYVWDALSENNRLDVKEEAVLVPANGEARVTYELSDNKYAVYLVTPTLLHNNEVLSKLDIRLVREDKDHLRINFPSLDTFPLKAGNEATVFACLHNGGTRPAVPDSELTLTLTDDSGQTVHTYEYTGVTTGDMMGVKDSFVPTRDYGRLTLSASLKQGGVIVDSAVIRYDCSQIDEGSCPANDGSKTNGSKADKGTISLLTILVVSGLALGVFALILWLVFYRKNQRNANDYSSVNDFDNQV